MDFNLLLKKFLENNNSKQINFDKFRPIQIYYHLEPLFSKIIEQAKEEIENGSVFFKEENVNDELSEDNEIDINSVCAKEALEMLDKSTEDDEELYSENEIESTKEDEEDFGTDEI
ncbi:hypothetical protein GVAV_001137 [Gurleya vavrai]